MKFEIFLEKAFLILIVIEISSYASAMKQIPTSAPMHSLTSLQAADLSVFDSIDGDVLEDYAVSLRPLKN